MALVIKHYVQLAFLFVHTKGFKFLLIYWVIASDLLI